MRGQPPEPTVDLARLHDIVIPQAISYAPTTIGWYIVGALLLMVIAWLAAYMIRRRRASRYRREALAELTRIERRVQGTDGGEALTDLDVLLKRVALAAYPRVDVASLSGEAWLRFLDRSANTTQFSTGHGRALADLPYATAGDRRTAGADGLALAAVARAWIRNHHVSV
jgi:hypothetical protein